MSSTLSGRALAQAAELLAAEDAERHRRVVLVIDEAHLPAERWAEALAAYFADHRDIGTGPDARGPAMLMIDEAPATWSVRQTFDDPAGDHDWGISAEVDLAASDEAGIAVVPVTAVGQP